MKTVVVLSLFVSLLTGQLKAQSYKVTTDKADSFSVALVKLLNCAVDRFQDCRADSVRTTWLMGTDHTLAIPFPGSTIAIVRGRDWDVNAYVEFRGFADKKSRDQGIRDLVKKIKNALGDQLYDYYENQPEKEIYFYGLSIKDTNGYFSMNMELFGGSSSAPIYLLGPEREEDVLPKRDFVLLKIYPGIPNYQYYIRPVAAPDKKLDATLRQLLSAAATDFDSMRMKKADTLLKKRKGMDTLKINGFDVLMNYRRSNYSANLLFPSDTAAFSTQWLYYQQALQTALGSDYVYHLYGTPEEPSVVYYQYGSNKPRVYLELQKEYNNRLVIHLSIESSFTHPTKRGINIDDF